MIKSRILSLELRPGQFLNEAAFCEMTGIGRMPVHQATHRLQAEGLIEVIPRKGLVIRMDSLHDVLALLEARLAIEPNVAALAAERISKEQCAELERLLKRSRGLADQSKRQAYGVIDRAFHGIIVEAAGNKILADTVRPLQQRSELFWQLRIMPEEGLEVTQREHEAVLSAILKHDAEGARKAMHAHLLSLHNRILKASIFKQRP
jgi:DNA-binding GntR family transcriptional regulator